MLLTVTLRLGRALPTTLLTLVWCFALLGVTRAQPDQAVYTDSLSNGWQDWSWATINFSNSQPVQSGTASISVSAGPYQALYLHHDAFDSSPYADLVFWIDGGSTGGQLLQVQAELNGAPQTVLTLPALAANTWQQFSIPLSSLGVQNQPNLDGFWIQDRSGTTQPAFFVDSISLKAQPVPSVVNVTVNATQALRVVDARHFGINAAVWDAVFDSNTTINLLTEMGAQALRFPGGSLSDDYHWATNTTDSNTWQWPTSFDNFAQVATTIGAQVFVTVNYGSGTPAEAAAWVQESNLTQHYGFKYWEIGNENYGSWETDSNTRPHDPYTYAQHFKDYYTQMKAVDPTIKIGAVAITGEDSYANYTDHPALNTRTGQSHNGWTPVMLATMRSLGVTPDFLIYHRYVQTPGAESDQGLLLSSGTWSTDAADLRQQLNDYLGGAAPGVELDCTENNSVYSNPGKQTTSLVNGLFLADSLCAAMSTEFNSVIWWDLRNDQENTNNNSPTLYGWRLYGDYGVVDSADPAGPADTYPTFYVDKLLQHFARGGDQLVSSASDYPYLSVCAAKRTNGGLTLLVVNKSASDALNANITVSGVTPASGGTIYSYGIPQDNAAQTGIGSADIATNPVTGLSTNFSFNFPAYSANVIAFSASGAPSPTPTASPTATLTPTATAKATTTSTATATLTSTPTATATTTATLSATAIATASATFTVTATPITTWTSITTPTATATPTGITFVAQGPLADSGSPLTSLIVSLPSGVRSGDILLAQIVVYDGTGTNAPAAAGWKVIRQDAVSFGNKMTSWLYYKVAGGSEPASYSWTLASQYTAGVMGAWRGVSASPIDQSSGATAGTTNPVTLAAPSLTPFTNRELQVYFYGSQNSVAPTITEPGAITSRTNDRSSKEGFTLAFGDLTTPSGGTASPTYTASSSSSSNSVMTAQAVLLIPANTLPAPTITTVPTPTATPVMVIPTPTPTPILPTPTAIGTPASTISFVNAGPLFDSSNAVAAVTVGVPSGVKSGDVLLTQIVIYDGTGSNVPSPPSGWNAIRHDTISSGNQITSWLYFRIAGANEPPSYSWTIAKQYAAGLMGDWRGGSASPIDQSSGSTAGGNPAVDAAPSLTPIHNGELQVYFYGSQNVSAPTIIEPGAINQRTNDRSLKEGFALAFGDRIAPLQGIASPTYNASSSGGSPVVLTGQAVLLIGGL